MIDLAGTWKLCDADVESSAPMVVAGDKNFITFRSNRLPFDDPKWGIQTKIANERPRTLLESGAMAISGSVETDVFGPFNENYVMALPEKNGGTGVSVECVDKP